MTASAGIEKSWRVGRYTCTATIPAPGSGVGVLCIEWEPHFPDRLSKREIGEYYQGRDKALAEAAEQLGVGVAVVDL